MNGRVMASGGIVWEGPSGALWGQKKGELTFAIRRSDVLCSWEKKGGDVDSARGGVTWTVSVVGRCGECARWGDMDRAHGGVMWTVCAVG